MSLVFFPKDPRAALMGPSKAQREAGNYAKPKIKMQGLTISIENPRGSMRTGVDPGGQEWATGMQHHYGYIKGTMGVDGDHVDVYLGPNRAASHAFIITTMKPPTFVEPDEQKVMLGFDHEDHAKEAFKQHYDDPRFQGECIAMPMNEFRAKVMKTRANPVMIKGLILFRRRPPA